ncbi:MAG TPA: thioesterase, partial [Myxococcota bacterium]|nr:thioesterase [Myxococcota bacterium]
YRLEVHYKAPAVHADLLEVRSTMQQESPYRVLVKQSAWRRAPEALLVDATVQLACIDREGQLCTIPPGLIPPT